MMEQYLVEMTVYDPALPGVRTLCYSMSGYTEPGTTPKYYAPRILQPGNYEISMFQPGRTSGESQIGFGEVRLANDDGELDHLLDYGFDGRAIVFKKLLASGAVLLLASCAMEQAEFTSREITVRIKDPQMVFSAPVQRTKYAGNNVLPAGIEGASDIKGKPKPLTYGTVYNITPIQVNTSKLIYQVHESTVAVPAVYDKGVALQKGTDYTSEADMEGNPPASGAYRVWPAGGCFRLGSSPIGQITADAVEGSTAGARTAAQVAKRLALRASPAPSISASDVTALDTANSAEVGIYISEETPILSALDQVLGSVGAWYGFDTSSVLRMQRLTAPTGTPDVIITSNETLSMDRVASSDTGRGVPPYKVNLQYQKNYTVQTSDLAGSAQSAKDNSHWDTATLPTGYWCPKVAYGNGTFVGILYGVQGVVTATDGLTWGWHYDANLTMAMGDVAFGNGMFVAASNYDWMADSSYIFTSTDGVNWSSPITLPSGGVPSGSWPVLCYGGGKFVLICTQSNKRFTSTDGTTWTTGTIPAVGQQMWSSLAYGNGLFVTIDPLVNVGGGANALLTSPDGVNWTSRTFPVAATLQGSTVFGNGLFVTTESAGSNRVFTSPDGITWSIGTLPANAPAGVGLAYGNGLFMSIRNGAAYLSSDGISWAARSAPASAQMSVFYGNGSFVMLQPNQVYRYAISPSNERVQWISKEVRTVSASDESVLTAHLLAPEMDVDTLLISDSAAATEAARLLTLYKVRRDTLQVRVPASVVEYTELGKVVKIVNPRYGYGSGKLFRVIGVAPDWASKVLTLMLWG